MKTREETVGSNIRKRRKALGMSQGALGAKAGLTVQSLSLIEMGRRPARRSNLEAIAQALGTTREALESLPTQASPAIKDLVSAITELEKENSALKAKIEEFKQVLSRIPSEWFARLAVKTNKDLGAIAARAFLTGDLAELRALRLPAQSEDILEKLVAKNVKQHLP